MEDLTLTSEECPRCGANVVEPDRVCKNGCPIGGGRCNMLRCPNCGYEIPKGARLATFLSRFLKPKQTDVGN
jgi:hypothetical protein